MRHRKGTLLQKFCRIVIATFQEMLVSTIACTSATSNKPCAKTFTNTILLVLFIPDKKSHVNAHMLQVLKYIYTSVVCVLLCACVRANIHADTCYLSIYLSTYLPINRSIHPSIHPGIHPSIHPSIYLSTWISFPPLRRMVVAGGHAALPHSFADEAGEWHLAA